MQTYLKHQDNLTTTSQKVLYSFVRKDLLDML